MSFRVLFPDDKSDELTKEIFDVSEVDPTTRPFQLTIEELNRMAMAYFAICQRFPKLAEYEYRDKVKVNVFDEENIVSDGYHETIQNKEMPYNT